MIVVYDVDDTLWGLDDLLYEDIGLSLDSSTVYSVGNNPNLTEEQKLYLLKGYADPEVFKRCQWYSGFERVFDLEVSSEASIWISSANFNERVKDVKFHRLTSEIPNINPEHVKLTVGTSYYQGRVPGDVLVDDSLENVLKSNFKFNVLLDKPHNRISFKELSEQCPEKIVVRVNNLNQAVDAVEKIVRMA